MKLGMNEVLNGIEYVAINKITNSLKAQGFSVCQDYTPSNIPNAIFDLYAEKGDDKRIYELIIGKNKIQNNKFRMLQEEAKRLKAKLFIIYLEIPKTQEIEFIGIENIIHEDLTNNFPSELDSLSTHTTIDSVDNIVLNSIKIEDGVAKITGSGTINVDLQFGSRSDLDNGDAVIDSASIDFFYKLNIDIHTNKVLKRYYKIDMEK